MAGGPIRISVVGDTKDLRASLGKAEKAMDDAAVTAKTAGAKIDTAFDSTAGHADNVASKGSQAAGALSGLGGLVGGPFGTAMVTGGTAMQAFADAGDLVNVVTESAIVKKIKDIAVTTVQTTKNIAAAIAQKAVAAATKAWAIAQGILNAVMRANPIGLVITAVLLLVGAFVIAYKKSETFRTIVNGAFTKIKAVVGAVIDWFRVWVPKVFSVVQKAISTYVNAYLAIVRRVFGLIKGAVTLYINGVKLYISTAVGAIKKVFDGLSSIVGKVRTIFGRIKTTIVDTFKGAINSIIDAWNRLDFKINISVPSWVPGIGGKGFKVDDIFPDIPRLATGGITTGPTVAMIGDNPGGREAVIPLDKYDLSGNKIVEALQAILAALTDGSDHERLGLAVAGALQAHPPRAIVDSYAATKIVQVGQSEIRERR